MNLDGQLERLTALYDEQSDEALLTMHASREDLTDLAQQALAQVMRSRQLSPAPASSTRLPPAEIDPESLLAENEVCVSTLGDAFEAKTALSQLADEGIDARVIDQSTEQDTGWGRRRLIRLGIVVRREDEQAARTLIARQMGVPPHGETTNPFAELDGLMQVGVFDRADALIAAQTLGKAGISFIWNDDRDDPQATGDNVSIEVKGPRLNQAQTLIDAAFEQTPS